MAGRGGVNVLVTVRVQFGKTSVSFCSSSVQQIFVLIGCIEMIALLLFFFKSNKPSSCDFMFNSHF